MKLVCHQFGKSGVKRHVGICPTCQKTGDVKIGSHMKGVTLCQKSTILCHLQGYRRWSRKLVVHSNCEGMWKKQQKPPLMQL